MGEKFCLNWNDFQATVSRSFRQLRQEKDFFDVTLVSDDEIQLPAHKLVLSACSDFFKSILKANAHSHPLLYLSGVTSSNLSFILDYMYQGEVQLYQEQLDSFLDTAQKLRIAGLLRQNDDTGDGEKEEAFQEENNSREYNTDFKVETNPQNNKRNIVSITEKSPMEKVLVQSQDEYEVKSKINELLSKENGMLFCGSCGKSGKDERNMRRHIETHIDGVSYPCEMCGKTFRSKNSRNCHKSIYHKQQ